MSGDPVWHTEEHINVGGVPMTPNEWHYVAVAFDGTSLKMYQDGVLTGSTAFSATTIKRGTSTLTIGAHLPALYPGYSFPFHGLIDEVMLFNRALSGTDVRALYGLFNRALAATDVQALHQATLVPGVLGNDADANGDTLTATVVTGPAHGTLTLNTDGGFTYTPAPDYNGPDSFTYKANDGSLDSNVATVNLTVNPVIDPPTVTIVRQSNHPPIPTTGMFAPPDNVLKATCQVGYDSDPCPVIVWKDTGKTYWAYSYTDNRSSLAIVAYDSSNNVAGSGVISGTRYIRDIQINTGAMTATFIGQAGYPNVTIPWSSLP